MQKQKSTVIEYEDPIALAEYEYFYTEYKDGLSLVKAITVCHLNDWQYPAWIRNALGAAMTQLYESTFPDAETKDHKAEIKTFQNEFDYEDADYAFDRYKKARKSFLKNLRLNLNKDNLIETHKRIKRDQELADLIADYAQYSHTPRPSFSNAYAVIEALADALHTDYETWEMLCAANENLSKNICGRELKARDICSECINASRDILINSWKRHENRLLEEYAQARELEV